MKRKIYALLAMMLFIVPISCYDDMGSYDYTEINELEIKLNLSSQELRFMIDTLFINSDIECTLDDQANPDRYSYEWKAIQADDYSSNPPKYILSNSKNLAYHMDLLPASYNLYYKIMDNETGLQWMTLTSFVVKNVQGRGYYLFGENENGNAALEMLVLSMDTLVARDLLKKSGLPNLKEPKRVMWTGDRFGYEKYRKLWVSTADGGYYLDADSYESDVAKNLNSLIYTSFDLPSNMVPLDMISKDRSAVACRNRLILTDSGDAFTVSLYNGEFYPNPVNRLTSTSSDLFKVFPHVFTSPGYFSGYFLYDVTNNCFVRYSTSSTYASKLSDNAADIFPWNQTDRTLVCGVNTMNTDGGNSYGNSFALMKDPENNYFIYLIDTYRRAKRGFYQITAEVNVLLPQAKNIIFSSTRTLMLFSIEKTLYAYDYNPGNEKLYTVDLQDEITYMRFDIETNSHYRDLFIATYNETKHGIIQKYTLDANHNTFEIVPDEKCYWENLIKVVDMDWRNSK